VIGNLMNARNPKTHHDWDEDDSASFSDMAEVFVPDRAFQFDTICRLLGSAMEGRVLDLCCGDGALGAALLSHMPSIHLLAYDRSAEMLARCRARLAQFGARFETRRIAIEDGAWRAELHDLSAVVSSLAVHHLDGEQKRILYGDMYRALRPGGQIVIADLVAPVAKRAREYAAWAWNEAVRRASAAQPSAWQIFHDDGWNFFEAADDPDSIDKPSAIGEHLRWLEAAGFAQVDVYWMNAGHAIYGATRPSAG
jgi:tRNA (cmo5U34)-methyltransferase